MDFFSFQDTNVCWRCAAASAGRSHPLFWVRLQALDHVARALHPCLNETAITFPLSSQANTHGMSDLLLVNGIHLWYVSEIHGDVMLP